MTTAAKAAPDVREMDLLALMTKQRAHFVWIARRITRNQQDGEDAVQNGFLRAWVALASFEQRASLKTWLGRIVANAALDLVRLRSARPEDNEVLLLSLAVPGNHCANLHTAEDARDMRAAIGRLPAKYADAARRALVDESLDNTSSNKTRRFRAYDRLRKDAAFVARFHPEYKPVKPVSD